MHHFWGERNWYLRIRHHINKSNTRQSELKKCFDSRLKCFEYKRSRNLIFLGYKYRLNGKKSFKIEPKKFFKIQH